MRYQTGEDFSAGGAFLDKPGCYHMIIADVREPGANKEGAPIAGSLFTIVASVGAGPTESTKGKTIELNFFEPKLSAKDGGAMGRKKVDRFLLATGLISEADKGKDLDIDVKKAHGRQFCVKLELRDSSRGDGKQFLDISYADIFHVDDPEVADWEKDKAMLAHIPKSLRRLGPQAPPPPPAKDGSGAGGLDL